MNFIRFLGTARGAMVDGVLQGGLLHEAHVTPQLFRVAEVKEKEGKKPLVFPCVSIAVEKIPVKLEAEGKTSVCVMHVWATHAIFFCSCFALSSSVMRRTHAIFMAVSHQEDAACLLCFTQSKNAAFRCHIIMCTRSILCVWCESTPLMCMLSFSHVRVEIVFRRQDARVLV